MTEERLTERLFYPVVLKTARLTRRGLRRLARCSMTTELLLQEAGVDVERLVREAS